MEIQRCAWCGKSISQQLYSENKILAKNTCLSCIKKMDMLPHDNLQDREDVKRLIKDGTWIDEYPYGTIVIDADDIVIKYNKSESQFTGLKPQDVEGKNFFTEIAPCTAVRDFQGVLNQLRTEDSDGQETIKFTFNHRNFFAYVSILMTYLAGPSITVLSIKKLEESGGE